MRSHEWIAEAQIELEKAGLGMNYAVVNCATCKLPEFEHPFPPCKGYKPTARWAELMRRVDERIAARKAA
jgi:hypothetical protein